MVTTDINGDGKPDLIVSNESSNTISVLLNQTPQGATSASFEAQQTFATGIGPLALTVGDVNGDGPPDVVVANFFNNSVSVLLNQTAVDSTTASFAAQQTFATGAYPFSVALGDLNGDGHPDLVVGNSFANTVSVLLNTTANGATTASFSGQQTFAVGQGPRSVAIADVNGDGLADLLVANYNSNTVSVLLNQTPTDATAPTFLRSKRFRPARIRFRCRWRTSTATARSTWLLRMIRVGLPRCF